MGWVGDRLPNYSAAKFAVGALAFGQHLKNEKTAKH